MQIQKPIDILQNHFPFHTITWIIAFILESFWIFVKFAKQKKLQSVQIMPTELRSSVIAVETIAHQHEMKHSQKVSVFQYN